MLISAVDLIQSEIDKLHATRLRRALWEDEQAALAAYEACRIWITEEREQDRVNFEKAEAEANKDPNQETKDVFASYRTKLKREGRMR